MSFTVFWSSGWALWSRLVSSLTRRSFVLGMEWWALTGLIGILTAHVSLLNAWVVAEAKSRAPPPPTHICTDMHSNEELIAVGIEPSLCVHEWVASPFTHYSLWAGHEDRKQEENIKNGSVFEWKSKREGRENAFERGMTVRPTAVELSGRFPEEKKKKASKQTHLERIHKQRGLTTYP